MLINARPPSARRCGGNRGHRTSSGSAVKRKNDTGDGWENAGHAPKSSGRQSRRCTPSASRHTGQPAVVPTRRRRRRRGRCRTQVRSVRSSASVCIRSGSGRHTARDARTYYSRVDYVPYTNHFSGRRNLINFVFNTFPLLFCLYSTLCTYILYRSYPHLGLRNIPRRLWRQHFRARCTHNSRKASYTQ